MARGGRKGVIVGAALGALVLALLAVGVLFLVGGDDDEPGPGSTARQFAAAWSAGDDAALRRLVTDVSALEAVDPVAVSADLGATTTKIAVHEVEEADGTATAAFTARLDLEDVGEVRWEGQLPLTEVDEEGWRVAWNEAALHPALPPGGAIRRHATWPERAPILGVGGQPLVGAVETVRIGIEPQRFDRDASVQALAEPLGIDPAVIVAALDAPGVQPDHFVPIAEVRPDQFDAVRDAIYPIPGVIFPRGTVRGGTTEGIARHIVGRFGEVTAERLEELGPPYRVGDRVGLDGIEARHERQLAGRPAIEVRVLDAEGEVVEVLASFDATAPEPVVTTIDPAIQAAAEAALADLDGPAALVAVDAATGEVRASVARPLGEAFNRAVGAAYPPGSTFKVVTAYALLGQGTQPSSTVECPGELVVDGRRFRNFEGGAAGTVAFSQAFAQSCNTAIIGAAADLPDGALAEAAATFGFGADYSLGTTTLGGSFPAPSSPVDRAAAAIGQAQLTASPLHMATVASAVLDGTWRSPILLPDDDQERVTRPLDPALQAQLADLMRLVVTDGSGRAVARPGRDVLGKTGTAEFGSDVPPATHAWFIAATDGLGIAIVLEDGGVGGRDAAPIAARFLDALPTP